MKSRVNSLVLGLLYVMQGVVSEDLPCAPRVMEYGVVCVCNSTYCDTLERPSPLSKNQYYVYVNGELSPGLTSYTSTFQPVSSNDNNSVVFTIDSKKKYQEILGFGGSFTDSASMVVSQLPEAAQEKFIESYFSTNGIEYSAGRVIPGASDFSTRVYTLDDTPGDKNLSQFALQPEDLLYKIPLIQKAQEVSPHSFRLLLSPFSAPKWMKTNDAFPSGYIKKEYYDTWARYLIKYLDAYLEKGLKFWVITESNEVAITLLLEIAMKISNFGLPAADRYFLKYYLGPQLKASNHSHVKYAPLDDQRVFAKFWLSKFTKDPVVSEMVAGVALHWYWDWIFPVSILDEIHAAAPEKLIIYSETSINTMMFGGVPVMLGSWERGGLYAYNIMENLNHWASVYLDWNMALNTEGGPFTGTVNLDSPVIVNSTSGEFYKNPMFYAMGIFSKFVPPGAVRVNVTSNLKPDTLKVKTEGMSVRDQWRKWREHKEVDQDEQESTTTTPEPTFPPFSITIPKTVSCLATVNPDNSTTVVVFNSLDEDVTVNVVDETVGTIVSTIPTNTIHTFLYWP